MLQETSEDFNDDDPISSASSGEVQPEPEVSSAGPLSVSTRVEYSALPHNSTRQTFGLVTLTTSSETQHTAAATPDMHRESMDLVCVLDVSGSMMGQKNQPGATSYAFRHRQCTGSRPSQHCSFQ